MRRKPDPREQAFRDEQVCAYVCGVDGCTFTGTFTLATWRRVREAHRAAAHPGWKPRKRRVVGSGKRARVMTEREMERGMAA